MANSEQKLKFIQAVERSIIEDQGELDKKLEEARAEYYKNSDLVQELGIEVQFDLVARLKRKGEVRISPPPTKEEDEVTSSDFEISLVWEEDAEYKDEKGRTSKGLRERSVSVAVCDGAKLIKVSPGNFNRSQITSATERDMIEELDSTLVRAYKYPSFGDVKPLNSRQA